MSKIELSNIMQTCANCGKGEEGSDTLKSCVACKMVKYCNRDCQIAHRPQHKKECKKRAAELHDEVLFKDPPPPNDCPICFVPIPDESQIAFMTCCGKRICVGCIDTMVDHDLEELCAFCRTPRPESDEEDLKRIKKLMKAGNGEAFHMLAGAYALGDFGLPRDRSKTNELLLKAGEFGISAAYHNLGISYAVGRGVERNAKKSRHYFELAAINGDSEARSNLGSMEMRDGNYERAYKHYIIAAKRGLKMSLDAVNDGYKKGYVTKDDYTTVLRAYQKSRDDMKSEARDNASSLQQER